MRQTVVYQSTYNLIKEALIQYERQQVDIAAFLDSNYHIPPPNKGCASIAAPPASILEIAEEHIHGADRVKRYGKASDSFIDIALVASILTGKELNASDCLLVQISQKLVRNRYSPSNPEHRTDAAGYLGILQDVVDCLKGDTA